MAPYSFYHINPLTGPLFAWLDKIVERCTRTRAVEPKPVPHKHHG